ncbi:MAG: Trm112 family protein [Candidatus Dadabacteria bacterium]|nr:Trm112 family protein [Candidatus Dadabacteria bacterium]NIS07233.1 Trm112 family protein [Candidatus Dadabacteria bacterium]NIV40940.1 Trm112 family protein [Candidatus Dadabacteria bacterium]NIX14372.1 Trm112 family protein [Candidatus Dadabacteria bacterium]NIY20890.1 Trm112 family protein [Candidatus Dadabacteria bacterium]
MGIDKQLLDILVCPKCKGDLKLKDDESGLICENCKLEYEIKEDIPNMLIEQAVSLESNP